MEASSLETAPPPGAALPLELGLFARAALPALAFSTSFLSMRAVSSSGSAGRGSPAFLSALTILHLAMTWYIFCFLRYFPSCLYPILFSNTCLPSFSYVFPIVLLFSSNFRSSTLRPSPRVISLSGLPSGVPSPVRYMETTCSQSFIIRPLSGWWSNTLDVLLLFVLVLTFDMVLVIVLRRTGDLEAELVSPGPECDDEPPSRCTLLVLRDPSFLLTASIADKESARVRLTVRG